MKLDKVEATKKKKNKKGIIIGTGTVAALTFCGIVGWGFFKDANNDVIKFAQSAIAGGTIQRVVASQTIEGEDTSYSELAPETIESLEIYLAKTGFGYYLENVDIYKQGVGDISFCDQHGTTNPAEQLYLIYNKNSKETFVYTCVNALGDTEDSEPLSILEKPVYAEDPGEKPTEPTEIESNTFFGEFGEDGQQNYYVKAWYTYNGETKESEKMQAGVFAGNRAEQMEEKARESIQAQYDKDYNEYERERDEWIVKKNAYNLWEAWSAKRNQWLRENMQYFEPQEPDETMDNYTIFWASMANAVLGLSDSTNVIINEEVVNKLVNVLYAQLWDEDGEPREQVNILNKYVDGEEYEPYEPVEGGDNGSSSGGSSAGGGSTGGGSTGGGSTGSGSTGGGSTGGGSTGGGSTGGGSTGSGSTGGNTTEDPIDEVAPNIEKVSVLSPVTGSYSKGQEIKIKVDFDKNVYGTDSKVVINKDTAPKLLIKFGDEGENKLATFDSVSGKSIIYTYLIEETDNGQLQVGEGNNYVGAVYNENGIKADLKNIEKLETDKEIEADNIGPMIEKIESISDEGEYKTGSEIEIKVTFNEKIYTAKNKIAILKTTAPILNISFGNGETRHLSVSEINNSETYLIYKYTITSEDRGTLKVDGGKAFDGTKTICDQLGNEVTLVAGKDLTGNVITANSDLAQISLDKEEITLDLNGTKTAVITATVNPSKTALTWTSSDSKVATVDEKTGTVTALAIGETTITVKAEDGTISTCKVTVKDTTNGITKVQLNKTKLELDLNEIKTANLIATVTPNELEIAWSSTDENIATVNDTGEVTAIAKGKAEIIAKAKDGTTATCEVKVINSDINKIEPTSIELNVQNIKVILGKTETVQLKTTILPSNSNQNTQITYESSDDSVATVDVEGKVSIKEKGTVVITATSGNGQKAYCAIEIVEIAEDSELNNKKIGDINEDEKIDTTDLLSILRHIATSSSSKIAEKHQDWILESDKYVLADINGNGVIDVTDSLKMQRHMAAFKNDTIKSNHPDWIIETSWE